MEKILTIQLKIDDSGKPMKPVFVEIDRGRDHIAQSRILQRHAFCTLVHRGFGC